MSTNYKRLLGGRLNTKSKVTIGIVSSLPILSALQSIYFLSDYRVNHRDAPCPILPSSGMVSVQYKQRRQENMLNMNSGSPLRLYVVGDSLAAGVGISKSGTPILPESIARSLSKQLGGRPVYWFCHGTAGASANRINSDIQKHLTTEDNNGFCDKNRMFTQGTHFEPNSVEGKKCSQIVRFNKIIVGLWNRIKSCLQFNVIPKTDNFNSHSFSQKTVQKSSEKSYDIVVVLTGLNDLKCFFSPFFCDEEFCCNRNLFKEELKNIFTTLKERIEKQIGNKKRIGQQYGNEKTSLNKTPMVVIPALPVGLIPLFQYPPLCWFSQIFFDFIDKQKKDLSKEYPGQILFISPPTSEMTDAFEKNRSEQEYQVGEKNVILLLQNVSKRAKKKIEKMMEKHRKIHEERFENSDDLDIEKNFEESIQHNLCRIEKARIGSSLVSIDKVHPNDDGYEFWGRHIASAIIQEWKIQ